MEQKLENLAILALDISGKNYLSWRLEAETYLDAHGLGDTIQAGKVTTSMQKAKALMFIRHHLHVDLKIEYITVKDPLVLWNKLKDRFDHQKTVILPKARYEWTHLRLQDFKSVSEYNSAMHRITSTLLLCGDTISDAEMLEKTFSTFHASNILLQQQYRAKGFTNGGRGRGYGRGRGRGRGYGRGRGQGHGFDRGNYYGVNHGVQFKNTSGYKKWQDKENNEKDRDEKEKGVTANSCYRCGSFDHWAKHCRTPKHLVALYQEYIKNKENGVESNFVYDDRDDITDDHKDQTDATHLDDDDFLTNE
ncbi:S-type anion channel SLAH1 isoform X1 [Tanacetum coccineum]|uniref:S-type anion channel SLAH1 isoform X1 n=1 Tax=Tanacetum coccineum TaxID=301880 RepID=A0ABQ5AY55_9ASTR